MTAVLSIEHLTKTFPVTGSKDKVHAVTDVTFSLNEGEVLGLVGESGSGKTTVGRCVLRLIEPDSGVINFHSKEVTHLRKKEYRPLRSQMQMVFQDPYESLNPRMTIREAIEEPLILFTNLNSFDRKKKVAEVLELVGLNGSYSMNYPHQLSGGQQQKVGIARAIILNPKLIVLDEPTSALDISVRAEIVELLRDLKEQFKLSYIFISHDLTAVKYISDRIAVMYLGQIVEIGNSKDIFSEQLMPYSRALLSSVLYPDINQKRSNFILKGEIPSPINLPTGCYLASRCPLTKPQCYKPIDLIEVCPGHYARCVRMIEEGNIIYKEFGCLVNNKNQGELDEQTI